MEKSITKVTCGRCGGSGKYSFNLMRGTVCFQCNGAGSVSVDAKAEARKRTAQAKREAVANGRREAFIACRAQVIAEFVAQFPAFAAFDQTTVLGTHDLNAAIFQASGKEIGKHVEERLKSVL